MYKMHYVQRVACGMAFIPILQPQSKWTLFNRTWQTRPKELENRLSFKIGEISLQMQYAILWHNTHLFLECIPYHTRDIYIHFEYIHFEHIHCIDSSFAEYTLIHTYTSNIIHTHTYTSITYTSKRGLLRNTHLISVLEVYVSIKHTALLECLGSFGMYKALLRKMHLIPVCEVYANIMYKALLEYLWLFLECERLLWNV